MFCKKCTYLHNATKGLTFVKANPFVVSIKIL